MNLLVKPAHVICARRHALRRLRERFGIRLNEADLLHLEAKLVAGDYCWLAVRPRRTIAFEVPIGGQITYPLFSVPLWAIVTFLPSAPVARPGCSRR